MTVLRPPRLPVRAPRPYSGHMNARNDGGLWPLPAVLGLWLFLMVQAVGIWVQPHQAATLTEQCAKLQVARR